MTLLRVAPILCATPCEGRKVALAATEHVVGGFFMGSSAQKSTDSPTLGYRLGVGAVWRSDKLSYQGVAIGGGRSCWAVLRIGLVWGD